MCREQSRKHALTRRLYDTLKKQNLMSEVRTAASDTVAQTVKSISNPAPPETFTGSNLPRLSGFGTSRNLDRQSGGIAVDEHGIEPLHRHYRAGSGSRVSAGAAATSMPPPDLVPSRHRRTCEPPHSNNSYHHALTSNFFPGNTTTPAAAPVHRNQLPGTARTAATRSQIPVSTSRAAFSAGNGQQQQQPPGSAFRRPLASAGGILNGREAGASGYRLDGGLTVGRSPGTSQSQGHDARQRSFNGGPHFL